MSALPFCPLSEMAAEIDAVPMSTARIDVFLDWDLLNKEKPNPDHDFVVDRGSSTSLFKLLSMSRDMLKL